MAVVVVYCSVWGIILHITLASKGKKGDKKRERERIKATEKKLFELLLEFRWWKMKRQR